MTENNPYAPKDDSSSPYGGYKDPNASLNSYPLASASESTASSASSGNPYSQQGQTNPANNPYSSQQQYGQPNYGAQPGYGQAGGYGAQPYGYAPANPAAAQGEKDAQTSLIIGVVGLVCGLWWVLGFVGLHFANKAARGGAQPTAGKVLAWINIAITILAIAGTVLLVLAIVLFADSSGTISSI